MVACLTSGQPECMRARVRSRPTHPRPSRRLLLVRIAELLAAASSPRAQQRAPCEWRQANLRDACVGRSTSRGIPTPPSSDPSSLCRTACTSRRGPALARWEALTVTLGVGVVAMRRAMRRAAPKRHRQGRANAHRGACARTRALSPRCRVPLCVRRLCDTPTHTLEGGAGGRAKNR